MRITMLAAVGLWTAAAAAVQPANFDRAATTPDTGPEARRAAAAVRSAPPRVRWAETGAPGVPLSPLLPALRAEAVARGALAAEARRLGVPRAAIDSAALREVHDLGHGAVIARFRQSYGGIEIVGRELNVVMDRDLRPVAISGEFTPLAKGAPTPAPLAFRLPASAALALALQDLSDASGIPGLKRIGAPPRMSQVYYADRARLLPAWRFAFRAAQADQAGILGYAYVVSAEDGAILSRTNLVHDANFSYRVYADPVAPFLPDDGPLGNGRTPFPNADPADEPERIPAAARLISLQNGPIATNDAWLADNALFTVGNNVDAYADVSPPDGLAGGDQRAPVSNVGTFDHATTADGPSDTAVARRGGVVNLFYVNNYLHDWWYGHGVTEAAGNAQANNYGRGGLGGDRLIAESQDYSGFNNARIFVPPDGESPAMEMFLYLADSATVTVQQPDLGMLAAGLAVFGPGAFDLSDDAVLVDDGQGVTSDGCEAFGGVAGSIAVVDRGGDCFISEKALNAQNAGATGVIVVNNVAGDGTFGMGGGSSSNTIPALSISLEDGDTLKAAIAAGSVTLRMQRISANLRDSALDNVTIAHEWFHYASSRLVGDSLGLGNGQGRSMGEGWSDFSAMLLVVRPDDVDVSGNAQFGGAYGHGVYTDPSAYFGVRRTPYSTNFAFNPLTFRHIADGIPLPDTAPLAFGADGTFNSESHASGEIWANVLWEVYAALLNDPRYDFEQARSRMMDYVIAGLKATPVKPTFLDARDALLAVARATDGQDYALMAGAFARRGMGAGAIGPASDSVDHSGIVESYVALAAAYQVTAVQFDFDHEDGVQGYCDTDSILDPGETVAITFSVRNTGTLPLEAGAIVQLGTDGDVSIPNGGVLTLPALDVGASADVGTTLTLASAAGTAAPLTLTADFPDAGANPDSVLEPAPITRILNVSLDLQKTRTFDDAELSIASEADWLVELSDPGVGEPWITRDTDAEFGTGRAWVGADNRGPAISTLTSPTFDVAATFQLAFDHYFQFEEPDYDGGVIEVSVDGGAWQDAVAFGATFTQGNGYNGTASAFDYDNPRPAFANSNAALEAMVLDFGSLLAGHGARIRFRIDTDPYVADFGWLVDNIAFNGISGPIFSAPVAEDGICENRPPHASAGADFTVDEGGVATLSGSALDRDGAGGLGYAWTRLSGPALVLSGANTATPQFTAPQVAVDSPVTFRLTVSDGLSQSSDEVTVTVQNVAAPARRRGGGGGALNGATVLAALLLALGRRRARR